LLILCAFTPLRAEVAYPPVVPGAELQFPQNEGASAMARHIACGHKQNMVHVVHRWSQKFCRSTLRK
jgi:hypothetical protein